jgi:hypothetical protein
MTELSKGCDPGSQRDPRKALPDQLDSLRHTARLFGMPEAAGVTVPTKKVAKATPAATKTGRPAHRPVVVGVVRTRTVKLDQELEDLLLSEYAIRRQLYKDLGIDYSEAAAIRQLLREAINAARAKRESGQQTLPLESTTTKS